MPSVMGILHDRCRLFRKYDTVHRPHFWRRLHIRRAVVTADFACSGYASTPTINITIMGGKNYVKKISRVRGGMDQLSVLHGLAYGDAERKKEKKTKHQ